jgi:predicted adenine nucleotide alpha hydrolase (AANH) superfamily ATPase
MSKAQVLDSEGRRLSPCALDRARRLVADGKATLVCDHPLTIQVSYEVELAAPEESPQQRKVGEGKSILLHTCCGPCSTYTIGRLRDQGFEVSGLWYNPNIHPYSEHQRRLASMQAYAESAGLRLVEEREYEMLDFLRLVAGREIHGERCRLCYELRLGRTAQVAAAQGFDAFTTTLLISTHQDQDLLRQAGTAAGEEHHVEFYFENFRRGWSERGRLTREHDLYRQQYCGCIYSEWERYSGTNIAWEESERRDD